MVTPHLKQFFSIAEKNVSPAALLTEAGDVFAGL
jgi:hypothetical protein